MQNKKQIAEIDISIFNSNVKKSKSVIIAMVNILHYEII